MGYSKKKQIGGWGHTFLKPHWKFSFIYFTPGNSRQINAPPLEIVQNCIKSLGSSKTKNQDHLEIPHNFFLVTPGNSTCYFFDTPGNSISSYSYPYSPPLFGFFLEQPNVESVCLVFFIWFWLVFQASWFCGLRTVKWRKLSLTNKIR